MSKEKKSVEYDLFEDFSNIDEENIIVGAVTQAVEKSAKSEPTKKFQKIEDFGEKIGGARKDFLYLLTNFTSTFRKFFLRL